MSYPFGSPDDRFPLGKAHVAFILSFNVRHTLVKIRIEPTCLIWLFIGETRIETKCLRSGSAHMFSLNYRSVPLDAQVAIFPIWRPPLVETAEIRLLLDGVTLFYLDHFCINYSFPCHCV